MTMQSTLIRQQLQVSLKHGSNWGIRDFFKDTEQNPEVVEIQWPRIVISPVCCPLQPALLCYSYFSDIGQTWRRCAGLCILRDLNGRRESCEKRIVYLRVYQRGEARRGRGSAATKGQFYLHGDAAEHLLKSAELKQSSPKLHIKSINVILEDCWTLVISDLMEHSRTVWRV